MFFFLMFYLYLKTDHLNCFTDNVDKFFYLLNRIVYLLCISKERWEICSVEWHYLQISDCFSLLSYRGLFLIIKKN